MTIIGALPFLLQNGTTADATQVDADFDQIVTDVNTNAAHNGTNNDITALSGLVTPLTAVQGGATSYTQTSTASTGVANAQVVATPVPAGFALDTGSSFGLRITFLAGFSNTDSMTLNVNGTGATPCRKPSPSGLVVLTGGEVQSSVTVTFVFDGTVFILETDASQYGGFGPLTALASAAPDLGTIASHNVLVTGSTTIASLGSSASLIYPIYLLVFNGALTLTQSAALVLPGSASILTASGDTALALYRGSGNWTLLIYQKASGAPIATVSPTTQVFTSGSGTYTPTSVNVRYIKVRLVGGGGGGGGGQNATPGATGGNTTFNAFTASGGVGGALASAGTGGAAAGGYSNLPGGAGGPPTPPATAYNAWGGIGGSSALGGGGAPSIGSATGSAGATNTGGGGGGGGATNGSTTGSGGAGGGAGGCVEGFLAATTYSYGVGAGGAGAAGASSASSSGGTGGAGAAGKIEVIEYY